MFLDLSGRRSEAEDLVYRGLSALGDHSSVWVASAIGAASLGRVRGRRTAAEVLAALGLSSFTANVVVKLGFRRRRPVSAFPVLVRRPRSRSFPSGHAATSFAAATVLAARYPAAAPAAYIVAGGIALSRIYVGVHYPLDVVAGAAVGTAIGAGVLVAQRPFREPSLSTAELESLGRGLGAALVVNPQSGREVGDVPAPVLVRELEDGEKLEEVLRDLTAGGAEVVGVAGGDGSVSAAARVAIETGTILWVVPGGTLNHFAKAVGAGDVATALRALETGTVARVDVGQVDDITFLNAASLGAYPDIVRRREMYERRLSLGKWPALALAVVVTIRDPAPIDVEVDGRRERALLVFVGNNPYHGTISPRGRDSLQTGLLDLRVVRWPDRWPRLAILAALLTGRLERDGLMVRRTAREVALRVDHPVALGHDGEVTEVEGRLVFKSCPGALQVLLAR